MWPFRKKLKQRRLEVRKNIPSQRGQLWQKFVRAGGPGSVLLAILFLVAAAGLVIYPSDVSPYRLGLFAPRQYARVEFSIPNLKRTADDREQAARNTPPTYTLNAELLSQVRQRLENLPTVLAEAQELGNVPAEIRERLNLTDPNQLVQFQQYAQGEQAEAYRNAVVQMRSRLEEQVIVTAEDRQRGSTETWSIKVINSAGVGSDDKANMIVLSNEPDVAEALDRVVAEAPAALRPNLRSYLHAVLVGAGQPTYRYDARVTETDVEAARAQVPLALDNYQADEVIFAGGIVAEPDLRLLRAERDAYLAWLGEADPYRPLRLAAGKAGLVLLVVLLLCGYVAKYQPRVVRNHWRGAALATLVLLMLAVAKAMIVWAGWNPFLAAGAAAMGAIIVTIAYDQRFALATGAMLSGLLTLGLGFGVGLFAVLMSGQAMSVFLLKQIRTRSKVIEVGALAAGAVLITAGIAQLAAGEPIGRAMLIDCLWGAAAVVAVGFLIQGLLPLIERTFGIATAMTLLELCDANNKLLKRLAIEAPGTYNHSLLLGTLCETAAEGIGANGLLARVGAYYHDIGKMNKPEYFVENQLGSPNKHEKLSPAMSLLIITGHVKDGLELAREYNLPRVLHEFIATHHGTTLVRYFYHAATEQRKAAGADRAPDEVEFRYPGPKPRGKEAAILMLADVTESSVRAMHEPTSARIESQAHQMISDRLMDGQLDDCELTLREVHAIEQSLVKSLIGIYHGRIAYPKAPSKAEAKAQQRAAEGRAGA